MPRCGSSATNRWLWLAVNLCTAFIASRVIGQFEATIEKVVALATLMTVVMGIAGNSGNQTMTLMIRSIALGQVTSGNSRRLILKEMAIAGLNGLVWGSVAGSIAWFIYRDSPQGWLIGLTLLLAMTLNMMVGAMVGMFVPLLLERSGRDPAIGSSVLLTFITDSMGVFIFLGLATLFFLVGRCGTPGRAVAEVGRPTQRAGTSYFIRRMVNSSWIVSL